MEKSELPKGWEETPLSEIAEINPTKPEKDSISENLEVSFVPMKCVEELTGKINLSNTRKYKQVRKGYTYFQDNDIIFAKITPCMENGKIAIAKELTNRIGFGSTEFHVVRLKDDEISRKFYFWHLMQNDFRNKAQRKMKGTAGQLRVPPDYMEGVIVPVPPLNEQQRIISKIEELFSKIDYAEQSLEYTKIRLIQFRQSFLKSVSDELGKKYKNFKIDELSKKITDGEHIKPNYITNGIPFLTAKNVRDHGVTFDDVDFVSINDADRFHQRCNPQENDILIVSRGATVGRLCLVNTNQKFCLLGSVILIKPSEFVLPKFLSYFLKSPKKQKELVKISGSTAQQAIYLRDIKKTLIPLPSLEEQKEIVVQLDEYFSFIEKSLILVKSNLKILETIRGSILKQAFEGKLVPQDPNDEPASELLKRIKASK